MHRVSAPSRASVWPRASQNLAWSHLQRRGNAARPQGGSKARGLTQQHTCHQQQPPGRQQYPAFVDPYQWMQDDPQKLLARLKEENQATAQMLAATRHLIQQQVQQLNAWHLAQALAHPLPSPSPRVAPSSQPPATRTQPSQQAAGLDPGSPHPSPSTHNQQQLCSNYAPELVAQHTWPDLLPTAAGPAPAHTTTTYLPTTSLQGCHAGGRVFTTTTSTSSSGGGGALGPWWVHGVWDKPPAGEKAQQLAKQQQQQLGGQPWKEPEHQGQCKDAAAEGTTDQRVWRLLLDEATLAVGRPLTSSREDLIHSLEVSPGGSYLAVTHQGRVLPAPDAPPIQSLPPSPLAGVAAAAVEPAAAAAADRTADGAGSRAGGGCKLLVVEVSSGRVVAQLAGCAGPILWAQQLAPSPPASPAAGSGTVTIPAACAGDAAGIGGDTTAHAKQLHRGGADEEQQQVQGQHHGTPCQQQHLLMLSAAREAVWCLTLTPPPEVTLQSPLVTPLPLQAATATAAAVAIAAAEADSEAGPQESDVFLPNGTLQLVHRDPYSVYCSILQHGQTALVVDHAPDGQPVAVHCWRPDWQPNNSGSSMSTSSTTSSSRSSSSSSSSDATTAGSSNSSTAGGSPADAGSWQPLVAPDESARLGVSLWRDWVVLRRHSPTHPAGQLSVAHLAHHPFNWATLDLPAAAAGTQHIAGTAAEACMFEPPSVAHAPVSATASASGMNNSPAAATAAAAAMPAPGASPWLVSVLLPPENSPYSHPLLPAAASNEATAVGTLAPVLPHLVLLCRPGASDPTLMRKGVEESGEGLISAQSGSSSSSSSSTAAASTTTSSGSRHCSRQGDAPHPLGPLVARVYTTCRFQGPAATGQAEASNLWHLQLLVEQQVDLPVPSSHLHGVTWCEATGELQLMYSSLTVPLTRLTVPLLQPPAAGSGAQPLRPTAAAAAGGGGADRGSVEERVALVPAEWEDLLPHLHQEIVTAVSPDGTLVPISIAYHQSQQGSGDAALANSSSSSSCANDSSSSGANDSSSSSCSTVSKASRPCLLHSYGFYGLAEDLSFDPVNLQLLQAGWVVAVAHLRGGGWGGRAWAAAGTGVHKQRALEDLQVAAAYLVQSGIAARGQLCLTSSSAGAALVLSTLLRPHPALMRGAVAAALLLVPACDHLGPLLRRGEGAFELGDPATDPQVAEAVALWDPYQLLLELHAADEAQHPHKDLQQAAAADAVHPEQAGGGASWLLPDVMLCAGLYDTAAPPSDAAKVAALLRATAATRWAQEEEQRWVQEVEAAAPGAQQQAEGAGQQQQLGGMQEEERHRDPSQNHHQQQQGQQQRVVVRVVPGGHGSCSGVPQERAIQAAFLLEAVHRRQQGG